MRTARSLLRRAVLSVWLLVVFSRVELLLRTRSIQVTCARLDIELDHSRRAEQPSLPAGFVWTIRRRAQAVDRLGAHWPFGDTCLRRCLVLGYVLRSAAPVLRLGVRRDDSGAIVAHSWLEVAGHSLDLTSTSYARLAME